MRPTKNIQGKCEHCGMPLEFAAESIGSTAACPYCHQETELNLEVPELEPTIPRRLIIRTVVAAVVLLLGLVGAIIALNRAKELATKKQSPTSGQTGPAR